MPEAPSQRLDLKFNAPQFKAYQAFHPGNTVFLGFGRGVGKSWFIRQCCWLTVAKYDGKPRHEALIPFRGVRITALAPTLLQWKDIHWAGIEEELGPSGRWAFLRAKFDRLRAQVTFPGGSMLRPFPASEYSSRAARGMRTDVLVADEVDDIPGNVYDGIAVPWLSEPWSLGMQLLAGTPTRGRHGLWWRLLQSGRDGERLRSGEKIAELDKDSAEAVRTVYSFHATYRDAPETVGASAVAKAKATTPKATFEREWEANPDAGQGLVYAFDESFHVRRPPEQSEFSEFHVGVDWGWSDAGVMLLCGVRGHGEDAELWVLEEHYESECATHIWDQRAKAWSFAEGFWCDPSRADRVNDLRRLGLRVPEIRPEHRPVLAGVSRVANMLAVRTDEQGKRSSRLYVSPFCVNTIREFGQYRRKKHMDGTYSEDPADKHNHSQDAIRYVAVGRFGRAPNYREVRAGR